VWPLVVVASPLFFAPVACPGLGMPQAQHMPAGAATGGSRRGSAHLLPRARPQYGVIDLTAFTHPGFPSRVKDDAQEEACCPACCSGDGGHE
jgi:hypothetical protein